MSLRDHLQSIYDSRGHLTPRLVVDEARPKDHPLHSHFEWDNNIAGEQYRIVQAREMIQSVYRVVYTEPDNPEEGPTHRVRAFHSVPSEDGPTYRAIEDVAPDPIAAELILRQAEREYRQFHARYRHLEGFIQMIRDQLRLDAEAEFVRRRVKA